MRKWGAPGTARPKGSGFSSGCESGSHPEREMDPGVQADAEHAPASAARQLFVVVREMRAEHAKAQIGAEHVTDLRCVPASAHARVPDPRREIRLDAEPGARWRPADAHRRDDAG